MVSESLYCLQFIKYSAKNSYHPDIIWIAKVFPTSYPLPLDNTVAYGKSYYERLARIASEFFSCENYRTFRGQHVIVFSWCVFLFCLEVVLPSSVLVSPQEVLFVTTNLHTNIKSKFDFVSLVGFPPFENSLNDHIFLEQKKYCTIWAGFDT